MNLLRKASSCTDRVLCALAFVLAFETSKFFRLEKEDEKLFMSMACSALSIHDIVEKEAYELFMRHLQRFSDDWEQCKK